MPWIPTIDPNETPYCVANELGVRVEVAPDPTLVGSLAPDLAPFAAVPG